MTIRTDEDFTAKARARFEQRTRSIRRAARRRWYRYVIALGVLAVVVYGIFFSPIFAVRAGEVQISGLTANVTGQSVDAVITPLVGTPLARLNTGNVEKKLEAITGVRSAKVVRHWPTGLAVSIDARVPAAVIAQGKEFIVLDSTGVQLSKQTTKPADLPVIGVPLSDANSRTIQTVLSVLSTVPKWLSTQVATVGATSQDTVTFTLTNHATVVWGDSSQGDLKAQALKVLLAKVQASTYDVSAPNLPVTK